MQVLVHIADAPCHGKQYHDVDDKFPDGDPAKITHDEMMGEVVRLNIQYWFGYVHNSSTAKMIGIFNESLRRQSGGRIVIKQFDVTNAARVAGESFTAMKGSIFGEEAKKMK